MLSRRAVLGGSLAMAAVSGVPVRTRAAAPDINERMSGAYRSVHDPCIIKAGQRYHVFSTGRASDRGGLLPWRISSDLLEWELAGYVFDAMPAWTRDTVPGSRGLWAPDIAFFDGRFHLYYSCSTFGSNRSAIGLAVNASLDSASADFGWHDRGMVLMSSPEDDFNAIDANHIQDREGRHWLALGSFWSGIKLFALDPKTGKPPEGGSPPYSIAMRPVPRGAPAALEAPFIIERDGYYYLFVSYDYCCKGTNSSYYIVVGRSRDIRGTYVGPDGKSMMDGYGMLVMRGNARYPGVGHCALLREADIDYLVYHAYDKQHDGQPALRISPVEWDARGWPTSRL